MVKRLRLNERSVREAVPEPGRDYQIFDSEVRGFAICIYRSGNRAFTLDYRHAGRQRRMTLGRWPEWSTAAARERAKELRRDIDAGGDPLGAKEDVRDAPRFRDLVERYAEVHLPNLAKTNASDQRSMLTKLVGPDWNNRLVTEITPYDVEKLLNRIAEGRSRPHKAKPNNRARKPQGSKPTPVRANRVGEVLRKMFTYAQSWGWRDDNPASGFRRRIENPRERFLSQEEIRKLAAALDAAEDRRAADIIRLCMLTGARVGEVRQARFEHFNLEHLSWSKPASMTKQRKIHRLPISDEAAAIVRQWKLLVPRGCAFLFPGDVPGQLVREIRNFWKRIQKQVGIEDDLIRNFLRAFRADASDPITDPRLMSDYIDARADTELKEWDVLFASAQKADATSADLSGIDMRAFGRSVGEPDLRQGVLAISGTSRRVGSPGDERVGLTREQIDAATNAFREERIRDGKPVPETLPPRIFCEVKGRRPLFILRFVEPVVPEELKSKSPDLVLAWSICFPPSEVQGGTVEYIVNTIRMREMFGEEEIEEEALGDTD